MLVGSKSAFLQALGKSFKEKRIQDIINLLKFLMQTALNSKISYPCPFFPINFNLSLWMELFVSKVLQGQIFQLLGDTLIIYTI